jgi:5'(3')-deoxyribonucleotidase
VSALRTLEIAIDLDAIIIDLLRPWLHWYNTKYEDNLIIDDLTDYKVEKFAKKTKNMFAFFRDLDNYANCPVIPGASEGLRELHDAGHDVIITTATAGRTAEIKWHHVNKAAPWIHHDNVMVGSRKDRIWADIFIDDAPKNLIKYRNRWPKSHLVTISYPFNKNCKDMVSLYAEDHNNTAQAWRQICDFVNSVARGNRDE